MSGGLEKGATQEEKSKNPEGENGDGSQKGKNVEFCMLTLCRKGKSFPLCEMTGERRGHKRMRRKFREEGPNKQNYETSMHTNG